MPKDKKITKEELCANIADRILGEVLEFHFMDMSPETIYRLREDMSAILSQEI